MPVWLGLAVRIYAILLLLLSMFAPVDASRTRPSAHPGASRRAAVRTCIPARPGYVPRHVARALDASRQCDPLRPAASRRVRTRPGCAPVRPGGSR